MGGRRFFAVAIAVLAGALIAPPTASATFHLMNVREVHPDDSGGGSYVVLQMYAPGQNFVGGHSITVHGSSGSTTSTFTFSGSVAGGANQATILVADDGYAAAFPGGPTPDATDADLDIPAAGGAVCFDNLDCVSWGSFSGGVGSPTGTPASPGGVTPGAALNRSIAANCSTLLEAADDTNSSSADFSEQTPNPRSNSSPIVESACVAPNTTITGATVPNGGRTSSTAISFSFAATPAGGATFECSLDGVAFTSCSSPQEYTSLDGDDSATGTPHSFRVRARNADGTDPSPAQHNWTVDVVPPTTTITDQPEDPSSGGSVSFDYLSNESGSTFECSLDGESFSACPVTGVTYNGLEDGEHTFEVRATDRAQNQGNSDSYTWTVDNSLADTTPPETTITAMPSNPSDSSTATFEYSSNEPGSSFECKLDGGAFADCPATGITYTGLMSGAHSFQVRAIDPDQNIDPTPAGYSFDVVVLAPTPVPEPRPSSSPSPTPPDSSAPRPGTVLAAGPAQVRGALALLRVRCLGAPGARCGGVIRLIVRVRTRRNRHLAARNLVIGQGRHNLPAGRRLRVVRVRLTGRGRRLVSRAGRRGLRARLVGARARNRVVTLRPAKRRSSRRRGGRAGRGGARQ